MIPWERRNFAVVVDLTPAAGLVAGGDRVVGVDIPIISVDRHRTALM
jgi:hypothetical protein